MTKECKGKLILDGIDWEVGDSSWDGTYLRVKLTPIERPKRKVKRWVNLYWSDHLCNGSEIFGVVASKHGRSCADASAGPDRIACVEIEVYE